MIQRKQTIYLTFSVVLFVLLFVFPFASFQLGTELTCNINILAIQNLDGFTELNYLFIIMQVLATLFLSLVGVAIFLFKKRQLQLKLCAFAFITNILMIGTLFLTGSLVVDKMHGAEKIPVNYLLPAYIPIFTLLLLVLAQRAIRKDEAMVQSLNRLR